MKYINGMQLIQGGLVVAIFLAAGAALVSWGGEENRGFEERSPFARVDSLASKFRSEPNEAVLRQIVSFISVPKHGAATGAILRTLKPHLTKDQIVTIVIPSLIKGVESPDGFTRRECAKALREYSEFARPAIPVLRQSLSGKDDVAAFAVETLGAIGPAASAAVSELIDVLKEIEPFPNGGYEQVSIRVYAAEALGKIGVQSEEVRSALEGVLEDANYYVVAQSVKALISNKIISQPVLRAISRLISSQDVKARRNILYLIEETDPIPPQILSALEVAVLDTDSVVRSSARNLIERIKAAE